MGLKYFTEIVSDRSQDLGFQRKKTSSEADLKDFFIVNTTRVLRRTGKKRFSNYMVKKRSSQSPSMMDKFLP